MMEPASLFGFALAVGVTAWVVSAALGGCVLLARGWLLRRGPELERAAASAALVTPAVAGIAVGTALIGQSLAIPLVGLEDHCTAHLHHLHLCLFHGAAWGTRAWAVALVAGGGALFALRLARLIAGHLVARRALRQLTLVSARASFGDEQVLVTPSSRVFVFLAGISRPRIFVSSAAWDGLGPAERLAAVAHERAHARRGDVLRQIVLRGCALLGAPWFSGRLLASWASAGERLCDREAATATGDPTIVARALVALARQATRPVLSLGASFAPTADELSLRVEALVEEPPTHDDRTARRALSWLPASIFAAAVLFADALHHLLETLLGMI